MANFKPQYTNASQVRLYLRRKASYGLQSDSILDSLTNQQINAFILNAESRLNRDLSKQYIVPFVASNGDPFSTLPQDTQIFIQEMCTWKAVLLILEIYWGSSEGDRGQAFKDACEKEYDVLLNQAKGLDENGQYITTPLTDLKLNPDASYRTVAGAPGPKSVDIGSCAFDNSSITRRKLTNLNKSLLYGWRFRGFNN